MAHLKTNHYMIYSILQKRKEHSSMRSVQNEVSSTTTNETPRMSPQPSIVEALERQSPIQSSSRRANDITDAIAYFLAKDSVPFNAVERPGFKRLLHVLEPRYHVPSKSTFSRDRMTKLYDATRGNVMVEIKNNVNFYAATTDMWSSRGMIPYIGFTLHWIDNEWVLRNRTLGTQYVPEEHTAVQLTNCIDDMLSDWKLDHAKMVAITTDNGTNIVKACKNKEWRNITCFGHNLHLAITNTINKRADVSRAVGVCKKTVAAFNMSWKRKKALREAQLQDEPGKTPLKLASVCIHGKLF